MKPIITIALFMLLTVQGYSQRIINKEEITPEGVYQIGGVSYFNNQLYLLLSSTILFKGKDAEAYEANIIAQKYQVWDIYAYTPATGKLENKSKQWKTNGAMPNGFCIIDDSTVVYINNKNLLESNSKKLKSNLQKINQSKAYYTDPFFDDKQGRIYFSSDLDGGKGKLDIWYVETKGSWKAINAGNSNTPFNDCSPSVVNDSLLVFSSENQKKQYDICFYNLKTGRQGREETPAENEFFTLLTTNGTLYYITQSGKRSSLWKGALSVERSAAIDNIPAVKVAELPVLSNVEPALGKSEENSQGELNLSMTNYFGLAKYDLTPLMKDSLNGLASLLKNNLDLNIIICGHASPDGPENMNMMLSYYRANEAYKWLIGHQVEPGRICRIFGGEYLFSDTVKARMFSIFTSSESDLPQTMVVYRLAENETKSDLFKRFNVDPDEMEYVQGTLKKQLPIEGGKLVLIPVKDIHIAQKGETIAAIAIKYGVEPARLAEANNMEGELVQSGTIVLIPLQ